MGRFGGGCGDENIADWSFGRGSFWRGCERCLFVSSVSSIESNQLTKLGSIWVGSCFGPVSRVGLKGHCLMTFASTYHAGPEVSKS